MLILVNKLNSYIKQQKIRTIILSSMIVVVLLLLLSVGSYWLLYENNKYKEEYFEIQTESLEYQKILIKREVQRTKDYIDYVRSTSHSKLMDRLSRRVDLGWEIANSIYNTYSGKKPDAEIKQMILNALRPYSLGQDREFVFIYTLSGEGVLLPQNSEKEGSSALTFKDSLGNYMVRKEVSFMKEVDKGFLSYYTKSKHGSDSSIYRTTYLRKFEPLNWYLGSKEYLSDFEERIKREVLDRSSSIKFNNDGYIFIQNSEGIPILSNGAILAKNMPEAVTFALQERLKIAEAVKKGGSYVEYHYHRPGLMGYEPKIAYVEYFEDWDWLIGAGFYTKDINEQIHEQRMILKDERIKTLTKIGLSILTIFLIAFFLINRTVKRFDMGIARFERFFKEASNSFKSINVDELYSPEFRFLATAANNMIDEIKDVKLALEKEQSLLISVINSIPDMIFFKDVDGKYIGCNKAFEEYLGEPQERILGKTDYDLFPLELAEFYSSNDKKILKLKTTVRNEEWNTLPNGEKRLFDTVKVLTYNRNNEIKGILCISRDITEKDLIQKKYIEAKEKAEEADRLKTAFLANMSHEIRTPMNSIVGFSNLIAEGGLTSAEQKEYVGYIDVAANSLLNLINDIIDIAKIEAGQLTIKPQYSELEKMMENVFQLTSEFKRKGIKTDLTLSYSLDEELKNKKTLIDPYRLSQVLTNLITNAIKFTYSGTIEFTCQLVENNLLFTVKDTGVGITQEDQKIIFNRFRQVGENLDNRKGGTGLGLAISKHIVDLMMGKIWVESEKNKGSVFSFEIPYFPLIEETKKKQLLHPNRWNNKIVLVIEQENASFNYLRAIITGSGAKVLRSSNASEAVEVLKESKMVDLIYTDYSGADDDIKHLMQEIKKKNPKLPVIIQTSSKAFNTEGEYWDSVITKPVKYHLLLESLEEFIGK